MLQLLVLLTCCNCITYLRSSHSNLHAEPWGLDKPNASIQASFVAFIYLVKVLAAAEAQETETRNICYNSRMEGRLQRHIAIALTKTQVLAKA